MTESIMIEDYYKFKFLQGVDIHSSGKIAYTVASYKKKNEKNNKKEQSKENENGKTNNKKENELVATNFEEHSHIWMIDGENHTQVTTTGKEQNPSWSPDGSKLIYSSKKDDKPQLYVLSMRGGEPRQLTSFENGVGGKVSWLTNSKIIFCSANDEKLPESTEPYLVTRDFFRMDAVGLVQRNLFDVYTLDLDNDEITQITNNNMHHVGIELSPDKTKAIISTMYLEDDVIGIFTRPYLLDIETQNLTKLSDLAATGISWMDDQTIVFNGLDIKAKVGSNSHIYKFDISTKEIQNLTEEDFYGGSGGFQADMPTAGARLPKSIYYQNLIYYNVQIGGHQEIRRIDTTNHSIETVISENANFILAIENDDLFFTRSTIHNPLDIFVFNLETKEERQLTFLNQELLKDRKLPEIHNLIFKGTDGHDVEGWLLTPQGSPPYPTLLNIHGGPHAGWGNTFQFENMYLLSAGYAVLMINQRGSTGYGEKFSSMIVGDWGNHDYCDLMAGVDQVIDMELADMNRLGCFGISGGGNLSSWIVGQTNQFKAAIPENPVTNWNSFFGTSDVGRWFARAEMDGLPWEIPDVYRKASPLTYAHNCTTPTLLIQHEGDLRCPAEQSDQFYNVLKEVGCETEMLRMPGTPHGGSLIGSLIIRERQNRAILSWFQRHIPTV